MAHVSDLANEKAGQIFRWCRTIRARGKAAPIGQRIVADPIFFSFDALGFPTAVCGRAYTDRRISGTMLCKSRVRASCI